MLLLLVVAVNSRHAVPVSHSGWQKTTFDVSEGFFGWARGNLRSDFSDVTLACDSLQAHKVLRLPLNHTAEPKDKWLQKEYWTQCCYHIGWAKFVLGSDKNTVV
jgi:hypothetical protein